MITSHSGLLWGSSVKAPIFALFCTFKGFEERVRGIKVLNYSNLLGKSMFKDK